MKLRREPALGLLLLCIAAVLSCTGKTENEKAAYDLAGRIVPAYVKHIDFVEVPSATDFFELSSEGKKLIVKGNNANSMAMGLGHYLRDYCHVSVSWYADDPVQYPEKMPVLGSPERVLALVPDRFFLNYCTFGYTMPFWQWRDWERLIDWMALEGINMPLAITGQEAVWLEVWQKYGMTEEEIRAYFTGPAHLPWHRMCNVDGFDGPLPSSWTDSQVRLQKKILERERALSMRPVLPAFSGHIPGRMKELYPDAPITDITAWGGFDKEYLPHFLAPTSDLFASIQKDYLEAQTALFGTDHIYGVDLFNEVDAPTWDPRTLAEIGRKAYESIAAVDPDAIWLQMGWMFHYDRKHWTPENVKAYLQAVPEDKVVILDYYMEHTPVWTITDSFFGQPYILCYLGNFGGNARMIGDLHKMSARYDDVFSNGDANFRGIGSTLEGFGVNQFLYEYLFDRAWALPRDDKAWVDRLADRHMGKEDETAREVWQDLVDKVYKTTSTSGQTTLLCGRPTFKGHWNWGCIYWVDYDVDDLAKAWKKLLETDSDRDTYRFDVVNMGTQVLGNLAPGIREEFTAAWEAWDKEKAKALSEKFMGLIDDIDLLASCEPQLCFQKWEDDAAKFASSPEEEAYYRENARRIVTTWGTGDGIRDYASRQWSGLVSTYCKGRWNLFFTRALEALDADSPMEMDDFNAECAKWEEDWVLENHEYSRNDTPSDYKALCLNLIEKYGI